MNVSERRVYVCIIFRSLKNYEGKKKIRMCKFFLIVKKYFT